MAWALKVLKACLVVVLIIMVFCISRQFWMLLCMVLFVLLFPTLVYSLFITKHHYSRNAALRTMRLNNGRRQLLRPLVLTVCVRNKKRKRIIKIPAGFRTDYSSIPTCLQWFVHWSKVDMAGVVHDWLYRVGSMKRKDADKIWRDVAMTGDNRANRFQAQACYIFGLRIGAYFTWHRYRKMYPVTGKGKSMGKDLVHRLEAIENLIGTLKSDVCTLKESLSEFKDLLKKCCDKCCGKSCEKSCEQNQETGSQQEGGGNGDSGN